MERNAEIELAKQLNKKYEEENFVLSPLGIEIILSLCSNGAEGETQYEILQLLNYNSIEEANKTSKKILKEFYKNKDILKIANAILTKIKSTEKFFKTGTEEYDAKIEQLKNYEQVNKWVKKQTNNNIIKIINSIEENVLMILLNAIYFEASWSKQFDPKENKIMDFFNLEPSNSKAVNMMILRGELLNYFENDFLQAVKLNYVSNNNSINAIIILPKENINNFINQFDNKQYEEIKKGLKKEKIKVNLFLPKFEVESIINMGEILYDLGIKKAFTSKAEFKGICNNKDLFIGKVLQKNYIMINEQGTKASSVTEAEMIYECYKDKDNDAKDFMANKPFLFLLINENFPKGHDLLFFTKICLLEDDDDY